MARSVDSKRMDPLFAIFSSQPLAAAAQGVAGAVGTLGQQFADVLSAIVERADASDPTAADEGELMPLPEALRGGLANLLSLTRLR